MKQVKRCPRFTTIRMASDGNNEAIEKILEHYNAYISKACLRPFYDECGGVQIVVDRELSILMKSLQIKALRGIEKTKWSLKIIFFSCLYSRFTCKFREISYSHKIKLE